MAFERLGKALKKPKYLWTGIIVAVIVAALYISVLTIPAMNNWFGWLFSIAMPLLVGSIVAVQYYNAKERKVCPTSATTGGAIGGVIGLATIACPICPIILLGWLGLGAAIPGAILSNPWIKLASLVVLLLALHWASKGR